MPSKTLVIDGMLSGTGIRDLIHGGYIDPAKLGLPNEYKQKLHDWQQRYELAHFGGYADEGVIVRLDEEGIRLAEELRSHLEDVKVGYCSDGKMRHLIDPQ